MDDEDAEIAPEPLDDGTGCGRSADDDALQLQTGKIKAGRLVDMLEKAEPDGGHTERKVAGFRDGEIEKAPAVEVRTRQHQLGAAHRGRVGNAPGINVEERHDQQNAVGGRKPEAVRRACRERMEHRRAVRIQNAFRIARRAGRVAERGRGALVELGPDQLVGFAFDEGLVGDRSVRCVRKVRLIRHRHGPFDLAEPRPEIRHERGKRHVEEQHAAFRVVQDVVDLLGKEPRIDRVQHSSDAGDSEIEFEMPVRVPGEGGDAVARADAHAQQSVGKPCRAGADLGPVRAHDRPLAGTAYDLDVGVIAGRMLDQPRYQELPVLHEPEHGCASGRR